MNMRKKLREFFTMTRRAEEGFTLVELIVVIAIVAILGGVAVPAYSGYIEKADRAADAQLLADVNKAFAAACIVLGEDNYKADGATATIDDESGEVTVSYNVTGFEDAFNSFYEGGAFNKTRELDYVAAKGGFVDPDADGGDGKTKTYNFGGLKITLNADDVAILSGDNAFSDRGSAALLEDVGTLENLLKTGIGEDVLEEVKWSDPFLLALGSYLGMSRDEYGNDEEYLETIGAYVYNSENADKVQSAQIMFAASQAANATEADLNRLFNSDGAVTSQIEVKDSNGVTDYNATMANAALAYGMYTAYQQRYPNADGVDNFTSTVNSPAFTEYYNSTEGKTDLKAYMAAMNMVSDNTDNSEVTSSILNNGITGNKDLADLMKEVMGK